MSFWDKIFPKKGTSLMEVPIAEVRESLPKNREHPVFKMMKEKHPGLPDEHIDMLIRFAFAAKQEGGNVEIAEWVMVSSKQFEEGHFFVKKSRGKYCLCLRKGSPGVRQAHA